MYIGDESKFVMPLC